MRYCRLIVTALDDYWLDTALREFTGYSARSSRAIRKPGSERMLGTEETPDGRPGAAVLAFGFSVDALAKAVANRTGQCLMTCPTTAVFDGLPQVEARIPLGKHLRFFGDGYQKSKQLDGTRLLADSGHGRRVRGGGIAGGGQRRGWREHHPDGPGPAHRLGGSPPSGGCHRVALAGVITPFPGGVVRSGSKVGSRYKALHASTSDAFCPTLRGRVASKVHPDAHCVYEIVIDGESEAAVAQAMAAALQAAAGEGVPAITAGNYGGKLGKFHFHLHRLLQP